MIRRATPLLAGALLGVGGCTDLPAPDVPFSVELRGAPSPSVVLGETLRDSLGIEAPLKVTVFNAQGDTLRGAAVKYRLVPINPDSTPPVTIDSLTGVITARPEREYALKTFRVYAEIAGIQTPPLLLTVTRRPDLQAKVDSGIVHLRLSFLPADSLPVSPALAVRLKHVDPAFPADSAVPQYEVRFRIVSPASAATDTSYVMLTAGPGNLKPSSVDTTDANGVASRSVRVRRSKFALTPQSAPGDSLARDTIRVEARSYAPGGQQVPGSPDTLLVVITARKPAS